MKCLLLSKGGYSKEMSLTANSINNSRVKKILKTGGIGIMPTDTILGMVGSALNPVTVERIYKVRRRDRKKPFIILIDSIESLNKFGITISRKEESTLNKLWPGQVSIILPCPSKKFLYLHRGKKTLAFRLPNNKKLRKLIKDVGPLIAPSANTEGEPPAKNIREAKRYFGHDVDFYVKGKSKNTRPSVIVSITGLKIKVLRS